MTQADLIRKLRTLSVNTDYAGLLEKEFGIVAPEVAPKYQQEYLYKYCLSLTQEGYTGDGLAEKAAEKAAMLFSIFPWIETKYSSAAVVETNVDKPEKAAKVRVSVPKNTTGKKPEGYFYFEETKRWVYKIAGKIVAQSTKGKPDLERVVATKFGS